VADALRGLVFVADGEAVTLAEVDGRADVALA
jgi:hypothetical protein